MTICSEPEESIRRSVLTIITAALSAMPATAVVKVSASGSQSATYNHDTKTYDSDAVNQVSLSIEPIWGFVE